MSEEPISMREHIEMQIAHLREMDALKSKLDEKALELQKAENAAHFDKLNHAAAKLESFQSTYVPRELFDSWRKGLLVALLSIVGTLVAIGGLILALANYLRQ